MLNEPHTKEKFYWLQRDMEIQFIYYCDNTIQNKGSQLISRKYIVINIARL